MIAAFASENHFQTYEDETSSSFSANCNVLLAILNSQDASLYAKEVNSTVAYLVDAFENGTIHDKWNLSPEYSMMLLCRALAALVLRWNSGEVDFLSSELIQHKLPAIFCQALMQVSQRQQDDGSWEHSPEATSYAIIAISHILPMPWHPCVQRYGHFILQKGRRFLEANMNLCGITHYHWVEKVSFSSTVLSKAYCLAAMRDTAQAYVLSPETRQIFSVKDEFIAKMKVLIQETPLFRIQPVEVIDVLLSVSFYYFKRLQAINVAIFPERNRGKDKYLRIVPFSWIGCNFLNNLTLSGICLWDMMVLSRFIYILDEYMENVVGNLSTASLTSIKLTLQGKCHMENDVTCCQNSETASGLERARLDEIVQILERFVDHICSHPRVVKSKQSLQAQMRGQLYSFLLAYI